MKNFLTKTRHVWERTVPFLKVSFSKNGLGSTAGRKLILGKLRRIFICSIPGYAEKLKAKHNISGGCVSCGASCNLLFRCPHWDEKTHLCTVYELRPDVCKRFPITPADIDDRNIILKEKPCGFNFK
jgi:hypothetical protein